MSSTRSRGQAVEARAARFLQRRGYAIVERNYRCPFGEIDIIAVHRCELVFVEVKSRGSDRFGGAELAVDWAKRRRLARVARAYLCAHPGRHRDCRFDVVAVTAGRVEHFVDAFRLGELG